MKLVHVLPPKAAQSAVGIHRIGMLDYDKVAAKGSMKVAEAVGDTFYHHALIPLVMVTAVLAWQARPSNDEERPPGFRQFQMAYICAFALCAAADWVQGPYIYALYAAYEYSYHQIALLFVAGFASSLLFSCGVGGVCDRFGRKKCALGYCVLYTISCLTKHVQSFGMLMLGRITGGVATSLLCSAFECWLVSEHRKRQFSTGLLSYMFGLMYTVNYLVAILSGIVGELVYSSSTFRPMSPGSKIFWGGLLVPFDLAIVCLLLGGVLIAVLWDENYGQNLSSSAKEEDESPSSVVQNLSESLHLLATDRHCFFVGIAIAAFEGSMFAFIFNWTPALKNRAVVESLPYGLIFALFMMSCMSGACISILLDRFMRPCHRLLVVYGLGALTMAVVASVSEVGLMRLCFSAFCIFEFCIGVYFPSMAVLKSEVVPERVRATVYNLYRVPLNAVVILALCTNMTLRQVFAFSACLLLCGAGCLSMVSWRMLLSAKQEKQEAKLF